MKVLVIAAGGYIGNEVAIALARSGKNEVYGLIRSNKYADSLIENEIIPIIGSADDDELLNKIIKDVSVVIDCLPLIIEQNRKVLKTCQNANALYIYTSGVLCYGNTGENAIDETHPVRNDRDSQGNEWSRIVFERDLLESGGVCVRPGYVYGKSFGKYASSWFKTDADGSITIDGNRHRYYSWIHITDLANAYVHIAEAPASIVRGEIFNVTDDTRITFEQMRFLFANVNNANYVEAGNDDWSVFKNVSSIIKSDKLKRYFGWTTNHTLYESVKLYQRLHK